jgi:hypothetical protein
VKKEPEGSFFLHEKPHLVIKAVNQAGAPEHRFWRIIQNKCVPTKNGFEMVYS